MELKKPPPGHPVLRDTNTSESPLALFASVSRIHIVAIASLGTLTFGWLLTGEHPWFLMGVCALDWYIVNLLNRVVDLDEDKANAITGVGFVGRHKKLLVVFGFALLLSTLVVVYFIVPAITPLRVAYHALGLAYNWPLLPAKRRIKQLYFFKNTASAVGFLLTVFGYPLAAAGWGERLAPGITIATVCVAATFFFFFELSYEVIYDLRDAPGDRLAQVKSYPVVHGERGAIWIIDGLILLSMVTLVLGYLWQAVPWRMFIMVSAPLIQLILYKWALKKGITSFHCIMLTWLGAGLLVTYHVWIALRLPGWDA